MEIMSHVNNEEMTVNFINKHDKADQNIQFSKLSLSLLGRTYALYKRLYVAT